MRSHYRMHPLHAVGLAVLSLFTAAQQCTNGVNVAPDNPEVIRSIVVEGLTFAQYVEQLGLLPPQSMAPWIVSPIPPPQGGGTITFSGWGPTQANLNSTDAPTIVLYEVLPNGCDGPLIKGDQLATTTGSNQEWQMSNIEIPPDVAVVGAVVAYNGSDGRDAPFGNLLILNSDLLKPVLLEPTPDTHVGFTASFAGQAMANLCLEVWRGAQLLGSESADQDGNWRLRPVQTAFGVNIIELKVRLIGEHTTYSAHEIYQVIGPIPPTLVWPFGDMERNIYRPDPTRGYITGWYGFNDYYAANYQTLQTNFHAGLDIGGVDDQIVRLVAPGIIKKENLDQTNDNYCGISVIVVHEDGWLTRYCHLKAIDANLLEIDEEQVFPVGTPLGIVGCTGRTWMEAEQRWVLNCYGDHLHIELIHAGKRFNLNPMDNQALLAFTSRPEQSSLEEPDLKYCHSSQDLWDLDWSNVKYNEDLGTSFQKLTCPVGKICKCEK